MKLLTTQTPEVLKLLLDGKPYRCNPYASEYLERELEGKEEPHFLHAYDYIASQMRLKIGLPPNGVKYPVWAWAKTGWTSNFPKPNSKRWRDIITCPGHFEVVMYLDVPEDQVLLSDFNRFHEVLNDFPILDAKNEKELEAAYDAYDKLPLSDQERIKHKSWKKIFNVSELRTKFETRGEFVQATFWELKLEYVKKVIISDRRDEKEEEG